MTRLFSSVLPTSAAAPQSYTIQPGDTLSQLAKTMGVPKDELLKLNPHITNEHHIEMFRELNVPKGCELPARREMKPTAMSATVEVKAGDSLTKIGKQYGVSEEKMVAQNQELKDPHMIRPGDKVKVPISNHWAAAGAGVAGAVPELLDALVEGRAPQPLTVVAGAGMGAATSYISGSCPMVGVAAGVVTGVATVVSDATESGERAAARAAVLTARTTTSVCVLANVGPLAVPLLVAGPIGLIAYGAVLGATAWGVSKVFDPINNTVDTIGRAS